MTAVGSFPSSSAAVDAVLDRHGIVDPARRRRIHREAVRRLEERATKQALRVLTQEALGQGWSPPRSAADVPESTANFAVPVSDLVYQRVLRRVRETPGEFGVRDLMRWSNFVETAVGARAVLDGLVAQGHVEVVPPPLRWPGELGRPPGTRYRAARGRSARVTAPALDATPDTDDVDDLDWSAVLRSDEVRRI
ncbi:MAG: hypothetical protein ACOYXM_16130 [Actinomycetota bacterium]